MQAAVENLDALSMRNNPLASQTSGVLKSPTSINNNGSGNTWKNFFGIQQPKQVSPSNSIKSPFVANNASQIHAEAGITFITSRLAVLTTPREHTSDTSSYQTTESIRDLLDSKHSKSYMIYSLEQYSNEELSYQQELFHDRIQSLPLFNEKVSPRLVGLLWLCQKITSYLLESPSNIAVIHCHEARNQLAFGACALLAYHQTFLRVDQIIQYYEHHRCAHPLLTMSQKRYIQYLCDLSFGVIEKPHFTESILTSITLSPVPLVNRQKLGCRPFVDIYDHENKKIFSTYQETAKLRDYSASDNNCCIPINIPFKDDLTIHITHATVNQSSQTHADGIRICEFTINSNFSTLKHPQLSYLSNELDGVDQNEKSPSVFRVTVNVMNSQQSMMKEQDTFSKQLNHTLKQPLTLFKDDGEFKQKVTDFARKEDPRSPDSNYSSVSRSSSRISGSFSFSTPQSPTSFINPWHNPFKQQKETSPTSSISVSPPLVKVQHNEEQTAMAMGTLLDIEDNDSNDQFLLERSISSDKNYHEFNSSLGSHTNLLDDDDFELDKPSIQINISQIFLPPPIIATTASNTPQHLSPLTKQSDTASATGGSNYNVSVTDNTNASCQSQQNTVKSNLPSNHPEKKTFNIHDFFGGLDGLSREPRAKPEPETPNTLSNMRRATLIKDVDPIVLKVRDWTEGKKRNIRALLCSLSNVTWPECTWTGCQMSDLIAYEQVKKVYRKAVLHIHPDKLRGDPNQELANLIFVELNEAWSQFERESN
ncbi:unnamed protein product [Rotaria socialis]|uniref:Tyrosine-protein phosphatase auxilin n=2 Tax=Rotaria socialis TaxID=392032 RepID=A0A821PQG3_9BILA|nr:unnamed protein product [Rotaria socialis]CAF4810625.1 unnamed protein product [Rotaria socialis]